MTEKETAFINTTWQRLRDSIFNIDNKTAEDIYAISFWKSNVDDDPRQPSVVVGYNTLTQVTKSMARASDELEAKWNFAFWLQNEELTIEGNNFGLKDWLMELPYYYTDEEESRDFEKTFEAGEKLQEKFMDTIIALALKLHTEGVIKTKFKKDIPIIIHELEYYDVPLNWTLQSNPHGLITEFEQWVNRMGLF